MESQSNVRALLELSGCRDIQVESAMADVIKRSPDPETAVLYLLQAMSIEDELLAHKWRKHIAELWFASHPKAPKSAYLPITSKDIAESDVLMEAYALMQEIQDRPMKAHNGLGANLLHPEEEKHLAHDLSVFAQDPMHVRRVCAMLEELRLVRTYKGSIRTVASRYKAFQAMPLPTQYYLLWHVDMYHLDWREYFPQLDPHVAVFQQYLPMVWEILSQTKISRDQSVDELTWRIVRAFRPMWQQEMGASDILSLKPTLGLYEQSVLQGMVEKWLIGGVLKRYGLIAQGEQGSMQWTQAGTVLLGLERTTKLPCSTDVLL